MSRRRPKIPTAGSKSGSAESMRVSKRNVIGHAIAACLLGIILLAIYGRAMDAPLVFDDRTSVIENQSITTLGRLLVSARFRVLLTRWRRCPLRAGRW